MKYKTPDYCQAWKVLESTHILRFSFMLCQKFSSYLGFVSLYILFMDRRSENETRTSSKNFGHPRSSRINECKVQRKTFVGPNNCISLHA